MDSGKQIKQIGTKLCYVVQNLILVAISILFIWNLKYIKMYVFYKVLY